MLKYFLVTVCSIPTKNPTMKILRSPMNQQIEMPTAEKNVSPEAIVSKSLQEWRKTKGEVAPWTKPTRPLPSTFSPVPASFDRIKFRLVYVPSP